MVGDGGGYVQLFDDAGWIASDNGIRWYIGRHHRARAYHGSVSNPDAFQNDCSMADPNIVADRHWLHIFCGSGFAPSPQVCVQRMPIEIADAHVPGD